MYMKKAFFFRYDLKTTVNELDTIALTILFKKKLTPFHETDNLSPKCVLNAPDTEKKHFFSSHVFYHT